MEIILYDYGILLGFGYLHGLEADPENPTYSDNGDVLLNNMLAKLVVLMLWSVDMFKGYMMLL